MNDGTGMPQTAVVIGGTSDIGRSILRALVTRRLDRIILAGRDQKALAEVADELRALGAGSVETAVCDVTDVAAHDALARDSAARLGQIDLVLVAAGVLGRQADDEVDPGATAGVLETNFSGPAAVMVAFARILRAQGHGKMVVLSSVAGVRVRRANFVYGSSKAGLDAFATGLAESLRGTGASVVVVRPGWVATSMTTGLRPGPLATTADAVAADVVAGLGKGSAVVWSPAPLRFVFAVLRLLPGALWRRMPG
jgi:decaprenylphospho-beta-D-erythro-pentofuranosid-2-ulose 2-reductase